MPAFVVLLAALLAVGSAAIASLRCIDAAGSAARLASRREPPATVLSAAQRIAPGGARTAIGVRGDLVTVTVRATVRLPLYGGPDLRVGSTAVAVLEPGPVALPGTGP
jgi:hypothetical protein